MEAAADACQQRALFDTHAGDLPTIWQLYRHGQRLWAFEGHGVSTVERCIGCSASPREYGPIRDEGSQTEFRQLCAERSLVFDTVQMLPQLALVVV